MGRNDTTSTRSTRTTPPRTSRSIQPAALSMTGPQAVPRLVVTSTRGRCVADWGHQLLDAESAVKATATQVRSTPARSRRAPVVGSHG